MKKKCKVVVMCILMAVAVLLEPASYAMADDASINDLFDEADEISSELMDSEFEFILKDFFDWFGIASKPEENCITQFHISHKYPDADYSLYNLHHRFQPLLEL